MKLRDKYENGSTLSEEYVLPTIIRLGVIRQIPLLVFSSVSAVKFVNTLIPLQTHISKKKLQEGGLNSVGWEHLDRKVTDLCDAPLWIQDIEVKSLDDYRSAEEIIVNEKIKYVFIDSLPETIDKSEIIKWSEEVGFNVYFTKFTWK